jgi:sugar phosphate isomerase/epimerase
MRMRTEGGKVPPGRGQVNAKQFVKALQQVGYRGPLYIEREVGGQGARVADIAHGIRYLKECLAG